MSDPLTPNVGATADAKRLDVNKNNADTHENSRAADFVCRRHTTLVRYHWPGRA